MKLAIDLDGVIANTTRTLRYAAKLYFKLEQQPPMPTTWELIDSPGWEFLNAGNVGKFFKWFGDRRFFSTLYPLKGATYGMRELRRAGHRLMIVTARNKHEDVISDTGFWLEENRIAFDDLLFLEDKNLLEFDIMLDDAQHNVEAAISSGKKAVLYSQPYNESAMLPRVHSWEEFVTLVSG